MSNASDVSFTAAVVMPSDDSSFAAEDCFICYRVMDYGMKGITSLACGHRYHCNCICMWFHRGITSCPMCRVDFSEKIEPVFKLGRFSVMVDPSDRPKNPKRKRLRRRVARGLSPKNPKKMSNASDVSFTAAVVMPSDDSSFAAEDCFICYRVMDYGMKGIASLACGHRYHYACICVWFLESQMCCPMCTVDFSEKNETLMLDPSHLPKNPVKRSRRRVLKRVFPPKKNDGPPTPSQRRVNRRRVPPKKNDGPPTPSQPRVNRRRVPPKKNDVRHASVKDRVRQQVADTCSSTGSLRDYLTKRFLRFFPVENDMTPTSASVGLTRYGRADLGTENFRVDFDTLTTRKFSNPSIVCRIPWTTEQIPVSPYSYYTDGSKQRDGRTGCGILLCHNGTCIWKEQLRLPDCASNNDAEITAILVAIKDAVGRGLTAVDVYSDSRNALDVLNSVGDRHRLATEIKDLVLRSGTTAHMHWVKAHSGNIYNETADSLAFSATRRRSIDILVVD